MKITHQLHKQTKMYDLYNHDAMTNLILNCNKDVLETIYEAIHSEINRFTIKFGLYLSGLICVEYFAGNTKFYRVRQLQLKYSKQRALFINSVSYIMYRNCEHCTYLLYLCARANGYYYWMHYCHICSKITNFAARVLGGAIIIGAADILLSYNSQYQQLKDKMANIINRFMSGMPLKITYGRFSLYSNYNQALENTVTNSDELDKIAPLKCAGFRNIDDKNEKKKEYSDPESCAVCLDKFNIKELHRVLPCGHSFHAACIDMWLFTKTSKCPLCNIDIRNDANKLSIDQCDSKRIYNVNNVIDFNLDDLLGDNDPNNANKSYNDLNSDNCNNLLDDLNSDNSLNDLNSDNSLSDLNSDNSLSDLNSDSSEDD